MSKKLMAFLLALPLAAFAYGCGGDSATPVEDTSPPPTPETDPGQAEAAGTANE